MESGALDRALDALAARRCRYSLYLLSDHGAMTVDDLAARVAALELGCSLSEVSEDRRRRVKTSLVHTHLPRLSDLGVVDYDRKERTVHLDDGSETFAHLLAVTREVETGPATVEC